jgi:hypothetical protein
LAFNYDPNTGTTTFLCFPLLLLSILIFKDEKSIIRQYLAHPDVKRRAENGSAWTEESYSNAFKVFVNMKQDLAALDDSVEKTSEGATLSYTALRERMDCFTIAFEAFKAEAYQARIAKR